MAIVALVAAAVVVSVLVFVWPHLFPAGGRARLASILPEVALGPDTHAMIDTTYASIDDRGRPFTVDADRVRRIDGRDDQFELVAPSSTLTLDDGRQATLSARIGHYDRTAEHMRLEGSVGLVVPDRYRLDTSLAEIDFAAGQASGSEPVTASGSFGTVDAEGFRITDGGERIFFLGRSRMILNEKGLAEPQ